MIAAPFKNWHFKYSVQWDDITCDFANMVWRIQPQEAVKMADVVKTTWAMSTLLRSARSQLSGELTHVAL